jgi:hypothetical protein
MDAIVPGALTGNYNRNVHYQDFNSTWKFRNSTVRELRWAAHPTDRLKRFRIETHLMLGCIAVAPAGLITHRKGHRVNPALWPFWRQGKVFK